MQVGEGWRESGVGSEWDSVADKGNGRTDRCTTGRYDIPEDPTGGCIEGIFEDSRCTAAGRECESGGNNQCTGNAEYRTDI